MTHISGKSIVFVVKGQTITKIEEQQLQGKAKAKILFADVIIF